ncbi:hypothetical protein SRB5_57730 [Streptomyces sp. RB5]|uniref:Uncharacterized protein n=1 Tax=Streptomyces smaragdinus TaxID=2585196 RepID=A0A7K0CQ54_9ACTN|nr:hypothetical protein [Streptomyces smaragdinus]
MVASDQADGAGEAAGREPWGACDAGDSEALGPARADR